MFAGTRQSRMEKVKDAFGEAVAYTDDLVQDKRMRSHLRSAVEHGALATDRLRHDINAVNFSSTLAKDKTLRKNLRALLEDLERASDRARRKRSHRTRNALLIAAGTVAAVGVVPNARRWVAGHIPASNTGDVRVDATLA
jgi:hypothetical protein